MNLPRRWPLDPRRRQAPRPRPGRFAGRRTPMTCTTTNRRRMAATYAPGTVRARRWHGEDDVRGLPFAPGLDGLRPPHRHSPRHRPHFAACRVVAHRNEGITAISTALRLFRPGRARIPSNGAPRPRAQKARSPVKAARRPPLVPPHPELWDRRRSTRCECRLPTK